MTDAIRHSSSAAPTLIHKVGGEYINSVLRSRNIDCTIRVTTRWSVGRQEYARAWLSRDPLRLSHGAALQVARFIT
jgi:hypothetical protein